MAIDERIKFKSLIILLYFWLHKENQIYESSDSNFNLIYFWVSLLANENLKNQFFLDFLILKSSCLKEYNFRSPALTPPQLFGSKSKIVPTKIQPAIK
jgi:hypothetical protein